MNSLKSTQNEKALMHCMHCMHCFSMDQCIEKKNSAYIVHKKTDTCTLQRIEHKVFNVNSALSAYFFELFTAHIIY